jgi:hypothetical protein
MHYMSHPFSMRLNPTTHEKLADRARRRGESKSRLAERLIEEGLRMEEHPGITFRDGPAGRRPALVYGPDVWELISTLQRTGRTGDEAIAATAEWGNLTIPQVRDGVRYYADYSEEIDDWIRLNREESERQKAAWERAQRALA